METKSTMLRETCERLAKFFTGESGPYPNLYLDLRRIARRIESGEDPEFGDVRKPPFDDDRIKEIKKRLEAAPNKEDIEAIFEYAGLKLELAVEIITKDRADLQHLLAANAEHKERIAELEEGVARGYEAINRLVNFIDSNDSGFDSDSEIGLYNHPSIDAAIESVNNPAVQHAEEGGE